MKTMRWCRTCGRYVSKPVEEHEDDPRYARFHAGAVDWSEAAAEVGMVWVGDAVHEAIPA